LWIICSLVYRFLVISCLLTHTRILRFSLKIQIRFQGQVNGRQVVRAASGQTWKLLDSQDQGGDSSSSVSVCEGAVKAAEYSEGWSQSTVLGGRDLPIFTNAYSLMLIFQC